MTSKSNNSSSNANPPRPSAVKRFQSSSQASLTPQALFYMFLLALQFGLQPLLTKHFTPPTVNRSTVVIMQEGIKFVMAMTMLITSGNWSSATSGWTISTWIKVAGTPALLYSIQNMSALLAYQNLDPITFNVLNQTKTLSAALCCYLIIGRVQSRMQVVSLFLLLLSALVIEKIITFDAFFGLGGDDNNATKEELPGLSSARHLTHGVAPVLLASFISGLAGALSQKNLQSASGCGKSGGRNPYLFSSELCVASILFLTLSLKSSDDGTRIVEKGFFDHWTLQTFIPIVVNALGGILVGLVTKYAGSVRKGFALIFGLFVSGLIQAETSGISKEQIVGGLLAALSLWMHSTHPYFPRVIESDDATKKAGKSSRNNNVSNPPKVSSISNGVKVIPKRHRKSRKED